MSDPNDSPQLAYQYHEAQQQQQILQQRLQQAKLEALQKVLGNLDNYKYLDLNKLIDPDNNNWADYTYRLPGYTDSGGISGHITAGSPVGIFINNIRNAEDIGAVYKQSELWDSYDPLSSRDNARKYFRYIFGGKEPDPVQATAGDAQGSNAPYGGSRPVQTTAGGTAGGVQGVQGVQAGAKTGNAVAGGGVQGSNNGSGSAQGAQAGNGTLASAGVAKGGTKTIGYDPYDPNPGNVSLAYAMRNAPEQERRTALINEWNKEHGISYATGKDGVIYRTDPQHPNGYVDPFKNDLSKIGSTGYATGKGMLTSGSNGTYSSQEGIETSMPANASGKFKSAWKDPMAIIGHYGRGAFTDNEYNQLVNHAVNDLGFNKDIFSGNIYR